MEIEILKQQCGGTEFVPRPHRLHLGAQNAEGVDRLQFILPAAWAGCTMALYLRRSDGVQLAAIPLDTDGSVTVDRRLTGSVRGQWMLAAMGSGGYTAYTRPGSYDVYATLPTDGGSEELPPSVYEQFVARVLESARAAAESARRAENGAADTAAQAALAQKAADKILADRTDADACAKRAEAAALRAESYAPKDGAVLSVNSKGGVVQLDAQDVAAVPLPAQSLPGEVVRILSVDTATGAVQTDTTPLPDLRSYVRSETVPTAATPGAVRANGQYGVAVRADATLTTVPATAAQLDRMTEAYAPLTPALLPYGVKKALTSAAGAANWSAQEKTAALLQLGADDRFYSKAEADRKFSTGYTLPCATADVLGGVKVGSGLTVDSDGRLSADSALAAYPVGSIYQSADPTSPAALFGGSWEEIASDRVLMGASSAHAAGTTVEAGLSNITGSFVANVRSRSHNVSGAFTAKNLSTSTGADNSDAQVYKFSLDASNSNAIYGASSTVQPAAYYVHIWRRVA